MSFILKSTFARSRPLPALVKSSSRPLISQYISSRSSSGATEVTTPDQQAQPLGRYYETILNTPTQCHSEIVGDGSVLESAPVTPSSAESRESREANIKSELRSTPAEPTTPPPAAAPSQVRIIFNAKLAGPTERAERLAEMRSRSRLIAGVMVPPRPEEPDNCCMSGCVNCVWDRYREEMEEWAAANKEAEKRLRAQEAGITGASHANALGDPKAAPAAIEGGGGRGTELGQASTKIAKDLWDDALYTNVPVGVKEFMKLEKKLKQKPSQEKAEGG